MTDNPMSRSISKGDQNEARCHWALLGSDLRFRYLDVHFTSYMREQASLLLNTLILDYIHPDDLDQVRHDFLNLIETRSLFGVVTKCRFARIHAIRRLLGSAESRPYGVDDDLVELKIIASWVGDGTILCFLHSIADRDAVADNDESVLSAWSNWCGYPASDPSEIALSTFEAARINTSMSEAEALAHSDETDANRILPRYVFQILSSADATLLLSHPPTAGRSADGSERFDPLEFARLAKEVCDAPRERVSDAKTSCSRRYRSKHPFLQNGMMGTIDSVVIRYQSVCFVCFQTREHASKLPSTMPHLPIFESSEDAISSSRESAGHVGPHRPSALTLAQNSASTPAWSLVSGNGDMLMDAISPTVAAGAAILGSFSSLPYASFASQPLYGGFNDSSASQIQMPAYVSYHASSNSAATDYHDPYSGHSSRSSYPQEHAKEEIEMPTQLSNSQGSSSGGNRACQSCGTTNSPEWRKGPNGVKNLCNACGLRFARSQARRTKQQQKELAEREGRPPPVSAPKKKKPKKTDAPQKVAMAMSRSTSGSQVTDGDSPENLKMPGYANGPAAYQSFDSLMAGARGLEIAGWT